MAYLAGFFNFLSPLFKTIINWMYSGIGSLGWTIVLFTILLKLVLSPLDVWQKIALKKTQIMQIKMAPELEKINLRYKNNKNELNQKTMECYKKHGFSPIGGCMPLVVNLLITLFLYMSMFSGMNAVSANITLNQFKKFDTTYQEAYEQTIGTDAEKISAGQKAVVTLYNSDKTVSNKFLWIENVSRKDSTEKAFFSASEYNKIVGEKNKVDENHYNNVMGGLKNEITRANGYFILAISVIIISILSSYVNGWIEKRKTGIAAQQGNILLKFLMPVILGVLCFRTASTFGLYLVTTSLITLILTFAIEPISDVFIKKILNKKIDEKQKVSYSR